MWFHKGAKQTSFLPPPPSGCNTTRWLLIRTRHQLLNEKLCQQGGGQAVSGAAGKEGFRVVEFFKDVFIVLSVMDDNTQLIQLR